MTPLPACWLRALVLAAMALSFACSPPSSAQERASAPEPPAAAEGAREPQIVRRSIAPDGTIELEYADGTTRRVPAAGAPAARQAETPDSAAAGQDQIAPVAPPAWLDDPGTHKAFLAAMGEYYAYRASGLQHRRRVFEWQLASSKIIFVTVLMLVGSGMVFAAIQFRAGLKRAPGVATESATEIDLSATSVKVSSPVLGVIILIISLAFFYLYLVYVYPISEIV